MSLRLLLQPASLSNVTRATVFTAATALLVACASSQSGVIEEPDRGVEYVESLCDAPDASEIGLHCGHLIVPEDYADPGGLRLRLPALRVGPLDPERMVVVLGGGGPGASATEWGVEYWELFQRNVLGGQGLLVVDQRGTGTDHPLRCPELDEEVEAEWERAQESLPEEEWEDWYHLYARSCLEHFKRQGIDLTHYTTSNSARDYENLRRAAGIRHLDLIGISNGGMIAFEMIRSYPESIRSIVLDSPQIPVQEITPFVTNVDRLFDRMASECLDDSECGQWYGDMRRNLKIAMRRLETEPLALVHPDWEGMSDEEDPVLELNHYLMPQVVFFAFYDPWLIANLPSFLYDLASSGTSDLASFYAQNYAEFGEEDADGLFNTIHCREQVPFESDVSPSRSGIEWEDPSESGWWADFCEQVWVIGPPIPPVLPDATQHPVLMLSGTLDPITPAGPLADAAARLPAAQHFTLPGEGHGSVLDAECGGLVAREFLLDPQREVRLPAWCAYEEAWWE